MVYSSVGEHAACTTALPSVQSSLGLEPGSSAPSQAHGADETLSFSLPAADGAAANAPSVEVKRNGAGGDTGGGGGGKGGDGGGAPACFGILWLDSDGCVVGAFLEGGADDENEGMWLAVRDRVVAATLGELPGGLGALAAMARAQVA